MNIEQFKTELCGLIDSAYQTAKHEGNKEIVFPFSITLEAEDQIEYHPLKRRRDRESALLS